MRSLRVPTAAFRAGPRHGRPLWIALVVVAAMVPGLHILAAPTLRPQGGPTPALVGPADLSQAPVGVSVGDEGFAPRVVTVTVGSVVRWTNHAQQVHTTTSDEAFSWSWTLPPGVSYAGRFLAAGTFPYHCAFHPTMTGTVVVVAGETTPTPPGPTATPPPSTAAPIVYWYGDNVSPHRPDLFALDPGSGASHQLTHTPALDELSPSRAPDHRRLAYAAGVVDGSPDQNLSIWLHDLATGAATAVTSGPLDVAPDWHPDGTRIAFTHLEQHGNAYSSEIAVVAPDGSARRTLPRVDRPDLGVRTPAWSPDGARLVFTAGDSLDLYLVPVTGDTITGPLTRGVDPDWAASSQVPLRTPEPGPTAAAPTTFPSPPTPSPTAPGPTATRPVAPTFPPSPGEPRRLYLPHALAEDHVR